MDTNERELESMSELMEDTRDPDYGWIDQWEQENDKYLLQQWIQETEQAGI